MSSDEYDLAPEPTAAQPRSSSRPASSRGSTNPHGTASPNIVAVNAGGYVRGNLLIVRDGATLPDRCVKCNAPAADGRMTKSFLYDEPDNSNAAMGLLPVVGIFFKFAWLFGKIQRGVQRVTLTFCLCNKHRTMRTVTMLVCVLGVLLGIGLFVRGVKAESGPVMFTGVALLFVGLMAATLLPILRIETITRYGAELKGAGKPFLASMPKAGDIPYRPPR